MLIEIAHICGFQIQKCIAEREKKKSLKPYLKCVLAFKILKRGASQLGRYPQNMHPYGMNQWTDSSLKSFLSIAHLIAFSQYQVNAGMTIREREQNKRVFSILHLSSVCYTMQRVTVSGTLTLHTNRVILQTCAQKFPLPIAWGSFANTFSIYLSCHNCEANTLPLIISSRLSLCSR